MHRAGTPIIAGILAILVACATPRPTAERAAAQVLFVCEHGNVKSLMAASYFNQLAMERGLRFRGVSRGSEPDSTTVPDAIAAELLTEGFDVSDFRPVAVNAADLSASTRVITIGTTLPPAAAVAGSEVERWNDVPPASTHYAASRDSLRAHIKELVEQLSHHRAR